MVLTYRYVSYNVARMTKKRLSRADSRERTAQRLVDAAERLIARRGLEATSVEEIAEAAGYSRGAFYSNFKSKEDLFFEVLRRDQEHTNARFASVLNEARPLQEMQAHIRKLYTGLYQDSDSFLTWTEGRMLSARDPKFRAKLASLIAKRRDFVVKLIDYLYQRAGGAPNVPLELLAMGFISLIEGLRLFLASCPSQMPLDVAQSILEHFIDSVMLLQALSGDASNGHATSDGPPDARHEELRGSAA
jgi:AcrR family transcriptional regulator